MKIKLRDGKPASQEATLKLEVALGVSLSSSFRDFLATHDGAKPEANVFRISANNSSGIQRFIPVREIRQERSYIEDIPQRAYPVAWDGSGNYIFIDEDKSGAVFFWDHEIPNKPTRLASSFAGFLELLEPFDIRSVSLKPEQVKKVWVDPEFLERLRKSK